METTKKTVQITTLTPSEGRALKKGDAYSTGVTAVDVSGWEEVSMAEYEAWKEAEKGDTKHLERLENIEDDMQSVKNTVNDIALKGIKLK